jgi:hypothetical protein
MEHKEKIALYLLGLADKKAEIQTENMLLQDAEFLTEFIETSERSIYTAPSGFAGSVMRKIHLQNNIPVIKTPFLSRKLCAAACFCSAAAIMLFTLSGFDQQFLGFIFTYSGKLNAILNSLKF